MSSIEVPEVVMSNYDIGEEEPQQLTGGLVNATYLVRDSSGEKLIVQSVNPLFGKEVAWDRSIVCDALKDLGQNVPLTIKTEDGLPYTLDSEGGLWIASTFIESDANGVDLEYLTQDQAHAMGSLAKGLHSGLETLNYTPRHSLPNFHNTEFYINTLRQQLESGEAQRDAISCGKLVLKLYEDSFQATGGIQLIHGDIAIKNYLLKDDTPVAIVDFDTVMEGDPWLDIGDYVRSYYELALKKDFEPSVDVVNFFLSGYEADNEIDRAAEWTKVLCAELAARFLIDLRGDYFSWDQDEFETREEHHLARAILQLEIAEMLDDR